MISRRSLSSFAEFDGRIRMAAERLPFISPEEYMELEERSLTRHEYCAGQIFAMAGGTPPHNQLTHDLSGIIYGRVRAGNCRGYSADQKVLAGALITYPDLTYV